MSVDQLSPEDFDRFFLELNDPHDPFPWQSELARRVCDNGWPPALDLPTASGKTAVLDIALFHLALEAGRGPARRAPLRMAFVVDRRLIVDQAETRARRIAEKLQHAGPGTIVAAVAERLQSLAGRGNPPLCIAKLRGGIPLEADWARTPVQPTILLSTVDQVGSRLLFRGYGVSDSMKPIHAGLLGSDCLIFLDEAHLSEPFRQTLGWIDHYRKKPWSEVDPGPWKTVNLSATLGESADGFGLTSHDMAHPVLKARLEASKPAQLIEIDDSDVAKFYTGQARGLRDIDKTRQKILIVVNRVDLARQIFDQFSNEDGRMLLIGRARDADREQIAKELLARLDRDKDPRPLFVVSTQCIEAGADVDFDALVTQLAPLDSLRQRFGRLNRQGRKIGATAVILATKEDRKPKRPDPVYGERSQKTWELLTSVAAAAGKSKVVDFGINALLAALTGKEGLARAASTDKPNAPVIPPAYVDLWARTSPVPDVDPEVSLFLHGPEKASADVEIVWRADITDPRSDSLTELIAVAPPQRREVLAMPIWKVQAWLRKEVEADRISDMEGESEPGSAASSQRYVVRWCGEDHERTRIVHASQIRAGDLIVVPALFGGCDRWGWAPASEPVEDVADPERFGRITVRIHLGFLKGAEAPAIWSRVAAEIEACEEDAPNLVVSLRLWERLPDLWRNPLLAMQAATARMLFRYQSGGVVISGKPNQKGSSEEASAAASTETDRTGNFTSSGAGLDEHTSAVVGKAFSFVRTAGISEAAANAIQLAAKLHDLGKGDRRFQAYLYGSSPGSRILAKSERPPLGPSEERRIRESVGLPNHWRHEALSVRLALLDFRLSEESSPPQTDRELALWLIGTHHGRGRPFFPHDDPADDRARQVCDQNGGPVSLPAEPGPQRADFDWNGLDWPSLFALLQRRYGAWELARMEAILRLADHRASEETSK